MCPYIPAHVGNLFSYASPIIPLLCLSENGEVVLGYHPTLAYGLTVGLDTFFTTEAREAIPIS